MSSYTPGPWRVGPPIFDGDVIFAPPQTEGRRNEVVAMGIFNKADARLIAAAPEMKALLENVVNYLDERFLVAPDEESLVHCADIRSLLKLIEGKEESK